MTHLKCNGQHKDALTSSPKNRTLKYTAFMHYRTDCGRLERTSASFKTFAPKNNKIFQRSQFFKPT
jgi:hypothetical protein